MTTAALTGREEGVRRSHLTRDNECPVCFLLSVIDAERARSKALAEALERIVYVIMAAGALNLSNGVQLGQVSWLVKMNDALSVASALLTEKP